MPEVSTKIGIGLHIVKNTMDLHHGLVTLESVSGREVHLYCISLRGKSIS